MKENEMGGACGTHGRGEESAQAQRKETARKNEE
jgi:hypothetical protein